MAQRWMIIYLYMYHVAALMQERKEREKYKREGGRGERRDGKGDGGKRGEGGGGGCDALKSTQCTHEQHICISI
jgi:hypothetical protein